MEQVSNFKYLGTMVSDDGRCLNEIKCRIGMAKEAFGQRKELLTGKLNLTLKIKIIQTVVWPVLLYGCETWTLRKEEKRRLEAVEMWIWRKVAKVSWTEKKTNDEVLTMVETKRILIENIVRRKKNWIGHILRGNGLMLEVMEGRMEGKRGRMKKKIRNA